MEARLGEEGKNVSETNIAELEALWQEAKR
jgi:hypothetical protein